MMLKMMDQIKTVIQQEIRPKLALHGGDIKVVSLADGILRVELLGKCAGCPAAKITTEDLVKDVLLENVPELSDVILVQQIDEDLLNQARALMGRNR